MKSKTILFATFLLLGAVTLGQNTTKAEKSFYFDFVMGPYLFVSHIPYDAVMMTGGRLGYEMSPKFTASIEYVVGQQQDDQHTLGLTHNVNGQLAYWLKGSNQRFNPYLFAGGGFMEFKSFTTDVYGIQYNAGLGTTLRFSDRVYGLIEARYFNLGLMDLGGVHELAVFWGMRVKF
ncbi:MAG: hypothetical protein AB8B74_14935 [Crocinitomicaceae bacterium]